MLFKNLLLSFNFEFQEQNTYFYKSGPVCTYELKI